MQEQVSICPRVQHLWMIEHLCKKDGTQTQELSKTTEMSPFDNYEFHLSIRKFLIHTTKEACEKVFYELKEGDIHWCFKTLCQRK